MHIGQPTEKHNPFDFISPPNITFDLQIGSLAQPFNPLMRQHPY
jgi:hypothetical protein